VVPLGSPIVVQYRSDISTTRLTHPGDWIGLYRRDECAEGQPEWETHWKRRQKDEFDRSYVGMPSELQPEWTEAADHATGGQFSDRRPYDYNPEHPTVAVASQIPENVQHQCWLAWERVPQGYSSHWLKFEFNNYKVAGDYDVRYFYGNETHEYGYQCGLKAGSPVDTHCLLKARGTSQTIRVMAPAEKGTGWEPDLPGLEAYCDGAYGYCGGGP